MAQVADIVKVDAPVSVVAGEYALIDVSVKNISSVNQTIAVTGAFDSTNLTWQFDYLLVLPGETVVMHGWFVMPSKNVKVTVWSWYLIGAAWCYPQDDTATKDIALAGQVGAKAGTIDYVRILKGSLEQTIPAVGIVVGDKFSLRVKVTNTGTAPFRPYLYYRYTKPDGSVLGSTEAKLTDFEHGMSHTFTEPAFGIGVDQPGNWYVYCELRDDYNGNVLAMFNTALLFNVGGVVPYTDLANFNLAMTSGTYKVGDNIPYSVTYSYKGPAQSGLLTITLRTLGYSDYTFPGITTELQMSSDWKAGSFTGSVVLPSGLVPGKTYHVRGVLRTADGKVEKTDDNLNVITIPEILLLTGEITNIKLKEGLITKTLPAPDMVKNDYFSVLVYVKNTSAYRGVFYCDCTITKPSGATTGRTGEQQTLDPNQEHTYQIQPEGIGLAFRIDETGNWYVECVLKSETEELARTPKTHLFAAGSEGGTSDLQIYELKATLPSAHPILGPGDTLKVDVTFKYTSTENTELVLWSSLSLATGRDMETKDTIQVTKSLLENTWSGESIIQVPTEGKTNGEYTLKVEVDGHEITKAGAVTLEGMPPSGIAQIGELIGALVMVMMMSMMFEMMGPMFGPEGAPPQPKPVTEAVVKGVKGAGRAVKKITEYFREED